MPRSSPARCLADEASARDHDDDASPQPAYYTLYSSGAPVKRDPKTSTTSSSTSASSDSSDASAPPHAGRPLTLSEVRAEFPALTVRGLDEIGDGDLGDKEVIVTSAGARSMDEDADDGWALMENAGGSQVPGAVADAVRDHMLRSYAQLGAGYPHSDRATVR